MTNSQYFDKYRNIMKFVTKFYFNKQPQTLYTSFTRKFLWKLKVVKETRGLVYATNYVKLHRLAVTRYLAGQENVRPFGIGLRKDGLPSIFPDKISRRIVERDYHHISWVLTLLQASRPMKGDPRKFKTDSITAPYTGSITVEEAAIPLVLHSLGLRRGYLSGMPFQAFPWISTAGPNGLSILRSMEDLINLPEKLYDACLTLNGGKDSFFHQCLVSLQAFYNIAWPTYISMMKIVPAKSKHLRRISVKADKEGKSRPFAIVDYISQAALTTLHDKLYQILKMIPQDATFSQTTAFKEVLNGGYQFYASYDLTSATDRFPITLQKVILEYLYDGQEFADAWADLMISEPFRLPNGEKISFEVGQPLGAKSSWAMFSLAHHFVVHYSALLIDMPMGNSLPYRLLGDDIVIMDQRLAESYLDVMTRLGVEISPTKSHVSKDTFEFAKRFGHRGVEISPFPITGLIDNMNSYPLFSQVLSDTAPERGFLPLFVQGNQPTFWKEIVKLSLPFSKKPTSFKRLKVYLENKYIQFYLLPHPRKDMLVTLSHLIELSNSVKVKGEAEILLSVPEILEALKKALLEIRTRELDKLSRLIGRYSMSIQGLLQTLMMLYPGRLSEASRITVSHREYLPVISSLESLIHLKVGDLIDAEPLSGLEYFKQLEESPIRPTPSLKGLQPVRPKQVVAQSRAALLSPFLNQLRMKKIELGKT